MPLCNSHNNLRKYNNKLRKYRIYNNNRKYRIYNNNLKNYNILLQNKSKLMNINLKTLHNNPKTLNNARDWELMYLAKKTLKSKLQGILINKNRSEIKSGGLFKTDYVLYSI